MVRYSPLVVGVLLVLKIFLLAAAVTRVDTENFQCTFNPPTSTTKFDCKLAGWKSSGVPVQLGSDEILLGFRETLVFRNFSVAGALVRPIRVEVGVTNDDFVATGFEKCEVFIIETSGNKIPLKIEFAFKRNVFKYVTFVTQLEDLEASSKFGISLESEFRFASQGTCIFHNLTVAYEVNPLPTAAPSRNLTIAPTGRPTPAPSTKRPSSAPTTSPTPTPSTSPTTSPTRSPTRNLTEVTDAPVLAVGLPTIAPSRSPSVETQTDNSALITAGLTVSAAGVLVAAAMFWRRRRDALGKAYQAWNSHEQLEMSSFESHSHYIEESFLESAGPSTKRENSKPSVAQMSADDERLAQLLAPSPTYARQLAKQKQEGRVMAFDEDELVPKRKTKPGERAVRPTTRYLRAQGSQTTKSIFRPSSQFLSQFMSKSPSLESTNPRSSKSMYKKEDL